MWNLPKLLMIVALLAACGRVEPRDYTTGGTPGGPIGGTTETRDGGGGDAGTDAGTCPDDPDGSAAGGGVVVSEVFPGTRGYLEILHNGPGRVGLEDVEIVGNFGRFRLSGGEVEAGYRLLAPVPNLDVNGEATVTVSGSIIAYVCWGSLFAQDAQNAAVLAGRWSSPGVCALSAPPGESLHLTGSGLFAGDFSNGPPTPLGCEL